MPLVSVEINKIHCLDPWHRPCSKTVSSDYLGDRNIMLRISENSENGEIIRLRLDGTLTAASYAELEAVCSQHQANGGKIVLLDMAGVVFMNDEVARKLANLRGERLRIVNCSPFIETLLHTVQQ